MLLRLKMNRTLSKTMMSHLVTVGLCRRIMPFFMYIIIMQCTFVNTSPKHTSCSSASGLTVVGCSDSQQRALREMEYFRQVSVPRAKRARRTPRVAMGQPGFCDYDLVLDLPSDEHDI